MQEALTKVIKHAGPAGAVHLRRTPTDVVLMDIRMPRVDGISATKQMLEEFGDRAPKRLLAQFAPTCRRTRSRPTTGWRP